MGAQQVIDRAGLGALIDALAARGHTVVGPVPRRDAIVLDEVRSVEDLPTGWGDEQAGGTYRLRRRDDDAVFGHAVGPHAWKPWLFPPRTLLWRGARAGDDVTFEEVREDPPRYAFLGVRGCDLAAIGIQDRVFAGAVPDPTYLRRRQAAFVVAVDCSTPAATCFCPSMGTGPACGEGHDLALTEVLEGEHRFVVRVGSDRGQELLEAIPHRPATAEDLAAARAVVEAATAAVQRSLPADEVRDLLRANLEHPRWGDVADRCLTCANCTMVCPTCFCSGVEDTTDLTGDHAERWRVWDSCFTSDFTELAGSDVRTSTRSRYRQWMTHKLASWVDQFGVSGCVGCGRCITWCPVGIDITDEVRAIRDDPLPTEVPHAHAG